jgi:hypothetical protein
MARITLLAIPTEPVGNVQPVYVSIANGTDDHMRESQALIYMQRPDGNRVPALPLNEAVNQAGGAAGLVSSSETAAAYGGPVGVGGAALGAASGAALTGGSWGGTANGMLIGGASAAILGAALGVYQAHSAAELRAQQQITNFSLPPDVIPPNATRSGYIYYPRGDYDRVIAVLGDTEANTSITIGDSLKR